MSESGQPLSILVVDDEEAMRVFLSRSLAKAGYEVVVAHDGEDAKVKISARPFDLVLSDIRMPHCDGMQLLKWLKKEKHNCAVIVMTGHGTIPDAIAAMREGAVNYVTKPFDRDEIFGALETALETRRLGAENRRLRQLLAEGRRFEGIVGSSAPMRDLYQSIDAIADRDGVALILGESGVGKELVARAIHSRSRRSNGPFVAFHCAALPAELLPAELFGVEEGAYSGASKSREGAIGRADGGTLFLDEIADVPLAQQATLLRLLENPEALALGSEVPRALNLRFVAATNRDLAKLVEGGMFRRDLYYRLNVFVLDVPPLRRRREDIPDLVRHFLGVEGRSEDDCELELLAAMAERDWPGNVRELENTVARLVAGSGGGRLELKDLPPAEKHDPKQEKAPEGQHLKEALAAFERAYLENIMKKVGGNVSAAARESGVSRPTLHAKLQSHQIDPDHYR